MNKILNYYLLAFILFVIFPINLCAQSLKEKAESGDKESQYQYARSLTKWYPKEEDYQNAFIWLKKSAEQGYAPAQCSLGYAYWKGQGISTNYEQAVYWYRKSAEQGNEIAQYNLAVCYSNGQGVTRSDTNAFLWYKKSADQGYVSAECALGEAYYRGKGVPENNKLAFEWFCKAADKKYSDAMYYLGECYSHGYGVTKNIATAIEWYEKSADDDNTNAEYALALLYLQGNGVEKDSLQAADLLLHSAGGGYCSPNNLINFDRKELYSTPQKKLLELSQLENSPNQHYFLAIVGCMYDAIQDYSNAEKYYKLAINKGSLLAMTELGLMYYYLSPCSDLSNELGLEGNRLVDEKLSIKYNKTKEWKENDNAAYWLEKAVSYGLGNFEYGIMGYNVYTILLDTYVSGVGTNRNLEKAIDIVYTCLTDSTYEGPGEWPELSSETVLEIASNTQQLYNKLFNFYSNLYTYDKNSPNGNETIRKIAYGGLGKCYYKGLGVAKDYKKAFVYLSNAVKYDNCESMRLLAACYRYGRGVQVNNNKDKEWSERAVKCGDERAQRLAELRGN